MNAFIVALGWLFITSTFYTVSKSLDKMADETKGIGWRLAGCLPWYGMLWAAHNAWGALVVLNNR